MVIAKMIKLNEDLHYSFLVALLVRETPSWLFSRFPRRWGM